MTYQYDSKLLRWNTFSPATVHTPYPACITKHLFPFVQPPGGRPVITSVRDRRTTRTAKGNPDPRASAGPQRNQY